MTAITLPVTAEIPQLRPLNILRDLPAVADLVETCFANTMDAEGRRYIQQMRRAGQDNRFLRWAATAVETVSMPLSGYVWEENGQIIGNASVIPYRQAGKRIYLIANVAVRADCRRRGIGRALTVAAMQHARQHHADETWLHVRDDNPGAVSLYLDLGFRECARRTTWQASTAANANPDGLGVVLSSRQARDWPQQEQWLHRLYPDLLTWYQPMPWNSLRPGLWPALYRFFMESHARHWAVHAEGKLLAVLSWQPMYSSPDRLWAAVPPEADGTPLTALLLKARQALTWRMTLSLDFPAGLNAAAIEAAGFRLQRTLLWMQTSQAPAE
jgi:ribosomal protein S18 acetylase RimI-like enzyme